MSTSREKMQQARELIQAQRYDEARAILRTVNHDSALDWLDKLDKLDPPKQTQSKAPAPQKQKNDDIEHITYPVVCAACQAQTPRELRSDVSFYQFDCPHCKKTFASYFVTIRAKRARTFDYHKYLSIRVIEAGGTEKVMDIPSGYSDFELRSKDKAIFSIYKDKIRVVQNLNVGGLLLINKAGNAKPEGCTRLVLISLVVFLVMIAVVMLAGH